MSCLKNIFLLIGKDRNNRSLRDIETIVVKEDVNYYAKLILEFLSKQSDSYYSWQVASPQAQPALPFSMTNILTFYLFYTKGYAC